MSDIPWLDVPDDGQDLPDGLGRLTQDQVLQALACDALREGLVERDSGLVTFRSSGYADVLGRVAKAAEAAKGLPYDPHTTPARRHMDHVHVPMSPMAFTPAQVEGLMREPELPSEERAEPIVAWKRARLRVDHRSVWLEGAIRGGEYVPEAEATCNKGHEAPAVGCRCGYNAMATRELLADEIEGTYSGEGNAILEVELFGRVIEGERHGQVIGYKASRQHVLGVYLDPQPCVGWLCEDTPSYLMFVPGEPGVEDVFTAVCAHHVKGHELECVSFATLAAKLGTEVSWDTWEPPPRTRPYDFGDGICSHCAASGDVWLNLPRRDGGYWTSGNLCAFCVDKLIDHSDAERFCFDPDTETVEGWSLRALDKITDF